MKIGTISDVHAKEKAPEKRVEKQFHKDVVRKKLKYVFETLKENDVDKLLIAGDLFDTVTVPHSLIANVGSLIIRSGIEVIVVPGQHDMRYHQTGIKNTPMGILQALKAVKIPTLDNPIILNKKLKVYGCGFGEDTLLSKKLPDLETDGNILLIHKMITKSKALFHAQIDWISGKKFLERNPFKIIISGDNHERFIVSNPDQVLINNGSLVRLNKAQLEYEPGFHIVDTDTLKVKFFTVPIIPYAKAFDMDLINSEEEETERRESLLGSWKQDLKNMDTFNDVSFTRTLDYVSKKMNASDAALLQISNFMEKVKDKK